VYAPARPGRWPAITWNQFTDGKYDCCPYEEALYRGYIIAWFDREQVAEDEKPGSRDLYNAYPEYDWGAVRGWAWAQSRVADYLLTRDDVAADKLCCTGFSRRRTNICCNAAKEKMMRYSHCPDCGTELTARPLGDEGLVPWCGSCDRPWFDSFSTCIIAAVMNASGEVLLQRESRRPEMEVLVAGYIKPGESAEDAARREIAEETGLAATSLRYMGSYPHGGGDRLMLGFCAQADGESKPDSTEVVSARWCSLDEAVSALRQGSIAQQVVQAIQKEKR